MNKPDLFIFSRNQAILDALLKYQNAVLRYATKHKFDEVSNSKPYNHIEDIAEILDQQEPDRLFNTAAIFDFTDGQAFPSDLDPLNESERSPEVVLARLVLAYPEVYWIAVGIKPAMECQYVRTREHYVQLTNLKGVVSFLQRHQNGYRSIFDASGLRSCIKCKVLSANEELPSDPQASSCKKCADLKVLVQTAQGKQKPDKNKIDVLNVLENRLIQRAVILDEEPQYLHLHGYAAYKIGYSTCLISSYSEMKINLLPELAEKGEKSDGIVSYIVHEILLKENFESICQLKDKDAVRFLTQKIYSYLKIDGSKVQLDLPDDSIANALKNKEQRPKIVLWLFEEIASKIDHLVSGEIDKRFNLAIEDLELKFADMKKADEDKVNFTLNGNKSLILRRMQFPYLNVVDRIIISGKKCQTDADKNIKCLQKPTSGIHEIIFTIKKNSCGNVKSESSRNLRFVCQLSALLKPVSIALNRLRKSLRLLSAKNSQDNIIRFDASLTDNHSTANIILAIAEKCLARARRMRDYSRSCSDAVYGSVLALEASELLYGRCMTTALEAFAFQQALEVKAECCFYGVSKELNVEKRLEEISRNVDTITITEKVYNNTDLCRSYNAQLEIVSDIGQLYNNYEQFEEALKCSTRIRYIIQSSKYYNDSAKILSKLWALFFEKYLYWMISSGRNILVACCLWVLIFALGYEYSIETSQLVFDINEIRSFMQSIIHSGVTFVSIQPNPLNYVLKENPIYIAAVKFTDTTDYLSFYYLLTLFEIITAYVHLGIFISYIYQKLSRK